MLTFDKVDRCVEYSVVLSARRDKVINILALPSKKIVNFGFEREEPSKKPRKLTKISENHDTTLYFSTVTSFYLIRIREHAKYPSVLHSRLPY